MPSDISFYDEIILGSTIFSIALNCYIVFLIFRILPKSMRDFRQCLLLLSFYDALFAFLMGPILNALFQPPALGAVLRGPIIMFVYRHFGYTMCKFLAAFAFYALVSIICTQNYGVFYRFFAILPNQKYYDCYNSVPGFVYTYLSCIIASSIIGTLVYFVLCDENEIPSEMLKYANPGLTFADYIPDQDVLILCRKDTTLWYVIVGVAAVGLSYVEGNSYTMFFIAKYIMKKYAASFTKQTYSLHRQFLYLLMIQITMPIFLIVLPLIWLILQKTFDVDASRVQSDTALLLMAMYSSINGLLTIFYISPFRKFTKRITIDVVLKRFGVDVNVSQAVLPAPTSSFNYNG